MIQKTFESIELHDLKALREKQINAVNLEQEIPIDPLKEFLIQFYLYMVIGSVEGNANIELHKKYSDGTSANKKTP